MRYTSYLAILVLATVFVILSLVGCNSNQPSEQVPLVEIVEEIDPDVSKQEPTLETTTTADDDAGYPSSPFQNSEPGYPVPNPLLENTVPEPPNPEVSLPMAQQDTGVVGGVLIWEVTESGFMPLDPKELKLAEVVLNSNNEPTYIRDNSESPNAQLFPTGIFIFDNVPPGQYGLVVDVGYSKFPIPSETEDVMLIEVAAGEVIDLGQIITKLPNS